jgi:hypothetical protein
MNAQRQLLGPDPLVVSWIVVPEDLRSDYEEAAMILHLSPKASAALGRRCLQHTIREATNIEKRTLAAVIDEVLSKDLVPVYLRGQLDAVREIGNFAAHPRKSESTDSVVDVEAGEAEWNLDILNGLFDFWYIQPAVVAARMDALNSKLKDVGAKELPST